MEDWKCGQGCGQEPAWTCANAREMVALALAVHAALVVGAAAALTTSSSRHSSISTDSECATALLQRCGIERGDPFACASCAGSYQSALKAATCTNEAISSWCAGPRVARSHYEDPRFFGLCEVGEIYMSGRVGLLPNGSSWVAVNGSWCSPRCSFLTNRCPPDIPPGSTATPTCMLQWYGGKLCALACNTTGNDCGPAASCESVGEEGYGICTYPFVH